AHQPRQVGLLREIERRAVQVVRAETSAPSPFAASLLFNYTANFLYEGDAPLAERRAAALSLDHVQLRELLGSADLRELLDEEVIAQVALEAAKLDRPLVRDADDVHDLLLGVGDLSREEIAARCNPEHGGAAELDAWLQALQDANRVIAVRVASEPRYAAAEDAARLRDALGANPPSGLPAAFLEMVATPLDDLVSRYARTHGPFTAGQAAQRLGLGESPVTGALDRLVEAGRVIAGEFVTGLGRRQWCDATVLRQIKRRSLARLRQQVEAAPAAALARFLPVWQGVTKPRRGLDALLDAIEQLQGAPLPASVLESEVLAARVADYQPAQLDELFLAGEVAWRGIESLGVSDGRIALYLTDQAPLLALPPEPTGEQDKNGKAPRGDSGDATPPDPAVEAVLALLAERGALRFDQIVDATGAFGNDLVNALWRLVWEGRVTNDTLAPVRSLVKASSSAGKTPGRRNGRPRTRGARFRSRRREHLPGSEGRWSLAPAATASPTERQAAVAAQLLQRYGVFTRSLASRESAPGGFAALYPVFKAMEEAGKARRGYFVEGLGGAQFASAGADDLLRAEAADDAEAVLLAATDPANAYGAALPWPSADDAGGGADKDRLKPQRAVGSLVVMVGGELVAYASRNGARMATTFADAEPLRSQQIVAVAKRLARRARTHGSLMIEEIDGRRPAASPLAEPLLSAGFVAINRGYVHRGE
ncbi:MAG: crosslink repair DNA glycosylase YcaQ family protein, partial [Planctomycetota bacterium]